MKKILVLPIFVLAIAGLIIGTLANQGANALVPGGNILVSINSSGTGPGNDDSPFDGGGNVVYAPISADGRFVAFSSDASDLVAGDTNGKTDSFVRDLKNNTTTRVNISTSGVQANSGLPGYPGGLPVIGGSNTVISSNGRYVAFISNATNLIDGQTTLPRQIFIRDTLTNTTSLATRSVTGSGVNGGNGAIGSLEGISNDGRFIVWTGERNSYLDPTGLATTGTHVYFGDIKNKAFKLLNSAPGYIGALATYGTPAMTCDGSQIVFTTSSAIAPTDTNGVNDIYMTDVRNGLETTRLVAISAGKNISSPTISCNGEYVAFASTDGALSSLLPPNNTNFNRFLLDRLKNEITLVNKSQSGVIGTAYEGTLAGIDNKGNMAFKSSANNLIDGTTLSVGPIYLRHKDTGFMEVLSRNTLGQPISAGSAVSMSADGKRVSFDISGFTNNMVPSDTNVSKDVIMTETGL